MAFKFSTELRRQQAVSGSLKSILDGQRSIELDLHGGLGQYQYRQTADTSAISRSLDPSRFLLASMMP